MSGGREDECFFTFNWRIENFTILPSGIGTLASPVCRVKHLENTEWYLELRERRYLYWKRFCDARSAVKYEVSFEGSFLDGHRYFFVHRNVEFNEHNSEVLIFDFDTSLCESSGEGCNNIFIQCKLYMGTLHHVLTEQWDALSRLQWDKVTNTSSVQYKNSAEWRRNIRLNQGLIDVDVILTTQEKEMCISGKIMKGSCVPHLSKFEISLLDVDGNERITRSGTLASGLLSGLFWKFPSLCPTRLLADEKTKYLKDGEFRVRCTFYYYSGSCVSKIDSLKPLQADVPTQTESSFGNDPLTEDFCRMRTKPVESDVILRIDEREFPAHRCVLSARSPVFCAMFSRDTLERKTGVVDIKDMNAETLNSFLEFLYTGSVDILDYESAFELMSTADLYQVASLKDKCSAFLKSALEIENACEIFAMADRVQDVHLKNASLNYIKSHASDILPSPSWRQSIENNVKLATEILHSFSTDLLPLIQK